MAEEPAPAPVPVSKRAKVAPARGAKEVAQGTGECLSCRALQYISHMPPFTNHDVRTLFAPKSLLLLPSAFAHPHTSDSLPLFLCRWVPRLRHSSLPSLLLEAD